MAARRRKRTARPTGPNPSEFWKAIHGYEDANDSFNDAQDRIIDACKQEAKQLLDWLDNESLEICPFGFMKILQSTASSWAAYFQENWNDDGLKVWGKDLDIFSNEPEPCKLCGHVKEDSSVVSVVFAAMEAGQSFATFLKAHPNYVWPAFPIKRPRGTAKARRRSRRR